MFHMCVKTQENWIQPYILYFTFSLKFYLNAIIKWSIYLDIKGNYVENANDLFDTKRGKGR